MNKDKKLSRKEELEKQLKIINDKEMADRLEELKHIDGSIDSQIRISQEKTHDNIMMGDFLIKFFMAIAVAGGFFFTVKEGVLNGNVGAKASVHFQMISVLGPLFGMILQYYFGKNKAGSNGE